MPTLFDMEPLEESGLKFNEAQRRAINHGEGPLLVIAGAGTGKTRVITERIRHLLQSDETLSGENILGLTFTKKAAGEMKARVVKATGERGKAVMLATFHSFCETLLVEADPRRLNVGRVRSLDPAAAQPAAAASGEIQEIGRSWAIPKRFRGVFLALPRRTGVRRGLPRYAAGLAARLEAEREELLDEDTLAERLETVALQQELARAYRASEELLRERKRVSFGSLITGAVGPAGA